MQPSVELLGRAVELAHSFDQGGNRIGAARANGGTQDVIC